MQGVETHLQVRVPFVRTWMCRAVSVALFLAVWALAIAPRGPLEALLATWGLR